MNLKLISPTPDYKAPITAMLEKWFAVEKPDDITPYAITRLDYHDFDNYCRNLDIKEASGRLVPDRTLFCYDEDSGECVGAVNIRLVLNERLLMYGGHIGDGVAPEKRGQGIGTAMVALALDACRDLGLTRVLMVCEKDNIPSARTIIRNGGVLENEVDDDGVTLQRYWIDL